MCCGPAKGKSGGFLARPDHHRGQAGYVLLILYLTKTQSIVIHSPVSSASVVKKRREKEREYWATGRNSEFTGVPVFYC